MQQLYRPGLFLLSGLVLGFPFACSQSADGPQDVLGSGGRDQTTDISLGGGMNNGDGDGDGNTNGDGDGDGSSSEECGNEIIESPETCDDGNTDSKDGCSSDCATETGYACPRPGEECVLLAVCGDGNLGPGEECDDKNTKSDDGCTAACIVELGWECPTAGSRCVSVGCGDGIIAGNEQCEDDDEEPTAGDGCSELCRLEPGFFCSNVGEACQETVCGNGEREGDEPCDDGNADLGDGCTPLCEREPTCVDGACTSTCGDGMILPGDGEECDDGNLLSGDGCDKDCKQEDGYECTLVTEDPPEELTIPIIYRDFIGVDLDKDDKDDDDPHPDFNSFGGQGTPGLVLNTLKDGKPQYADICDNDGPTTNPPCPHGKQLTTKANFDQWYNDSSSSKRVDKTLTLTRNDAGQYVFDSQGNFFPLDDAGWVASNDEKKSDWHNFSFTSELRYWFQLEGDETLTFNGDDDVWVFINNRLMIDLGGLHSAKNATIVLTDEVIEDLEMEKGRIYEVVLFHAERHTDESNFRLTLNGFVRTTSECVAECGDGIVAGDEVCDDGDDNGSYGHCKDDCSGLGQRCGDGTVQEDEGEVCDDGTNLTSYDFEMSQEGCAPGCQVPASCGDDHVDVAFGEQCDDGNLKDGDTCEANCTNRKKCGDGTIDKKDGETCDDGNRKNGDGCSQFCTEEMDIIR